MPSLLLAAFPPEFAGLDAAPPPGWRAACTGVGAVAAASTTARLLAELRPDRVLFLGTCGALDPSLGIGDLISASEVLATSLDELEGRAFRPAIEIVRWPSTWSLPLPARTVAVPPAITGTQDGAARMARVAALEHLELSGVFAACAASGIPVAAALAVANRVGPGAHAEWSAHHAEASRRLREALEDLGVFS